jgi:hypothetical protein
MGTNKRYAASADRQMDARIAERVMVGEPETLSTQELQLGKLPVTRTPAPEAVKAWVRYGTVPIEIEAEAVAWTPRAVAIRWVTPKGELHKAWVWASAVERVPVDESHRRSPDRP